MVRMDKSEKNRCYSPFELTIIIHNANNLPIADFTTSDPFVEILLGPLYQDNEKSFVKKTKTSIVYRNTSPKWEETFTIASEILHLNKALKFAIKDDDKDNKDADYLGFVIVDLSRLPINEMVKKVYDVQAVGKFIDQKRHSTITVSIEIKQNNDVVKIVDDIKMNHLKEATYNESYELSIDKFDIINSELIAANASPCVRATVLRFAQNDFRMQFFQIDVLRDLLSDVTSLTRNTSDLRPELSAQLRRNVLKVRNASIFEFKNSIWRRHSPIESNCILLNLSEAGDRFVLLKFRNRFNMWYWFRWILILQQVWTGKLTRDDFPPWILNSEEKFSSRISLLTHTGDSLVDISVTVSLSIPFRLTMKDGPISLEGMTSAVLSLDSISPKPNVLVLEVKSCSTGDDSTSLRHSIPHESSQQETRKGIRNSLVGAFKGLQHLTGEKKEKDVGLVLDTVLEVKFQGVSQSTEHLSTSLKNWNQVFYMDFDPDAPKSNIIPSSSKESIPDCNSPQFGVDFLIYNDVEDKGVKLLTLRSLQHVTLQELLLHHSNQDSNSTDGKAKEKSRNLNNLAINQYFDIPLNSSTELVATLFSAKGLHVPRRSTSGKLVVKCKLVDWKGHGYNGDELKSDKVAASADCDWGSDGFVFRYRISDSYDKASYLRLEVFSDQVSIGAAFIPVEYFGSAEKQYQFPLHPFRYSSSSKSDLSSSGELNIAVKLVSEEVWNSTDVINVKTTVRKSNLFNNAWFAECLMSEKIESDSCMDNIECFSVFHSSESLILYGIEDTSSCYKGIEEVNDITEGSLLEGRRTRTVKLFIVAKSEPSTIPTSTSAYSNISVVDKGVQVEVFENQGRQTYFPFHFTSTAFLTCPRFSDITYDVAYNFDTLTAASPPAGFKWSSDWQVDREYTQTDSEGWSYAFTFGSILSNYKSGASVIRKGHNQARRRKWVRHCCLIEKGSELIYNPMEFARVNSSSPSKEQKGKSIVLHFDGNKSDSDWRKRSLQSNPASLVALCKERSQINSPVLIPWDQVISSSIISQSVLSVNFQVHRYVGEENNVLKFQVVEVEAFVSNCPSHEFNQIIAERKFFSKMRSDIKLLIQSGNLSGLADLDESERMDTTDGFIPTGELSFGSSIIETLDDYCLALEPVLHQQIELYKKNDGKEAKTELKIMLRRHARLRLYIAALLSAGLKGDHDFSEEGVSDLMNKDFSKCACIQIIEEINGEEVENPVKTASDRIGFLLDVSEQRIRDTTLCGWNYSGGVLEDRLSQLVNGYLISIVKELGIFFDNDVSIKGLSNKITLVTTFMKDNVRLERMTESSLRPYGLVVFPHAKLTLYLDFTKLEKWYTSIVEEEMKQFVDKVFISHRKGKEDEYPQVVTPWIPNERCLTSEIMKEVIELLKFYLDNAKIRKEDVDPTFHPLMGKFDEALLLSCNACFFHSVQSYFTALEESNHSFLSFLVKHANDSESTDQFMVEIMDYAVFTISIANDTRNMITNKLFNEAAVAIGYRNLSDASKDKVLEGIQNTYTFAEKVMMNALDTLSCIYFSYLIYFKLIGADYLFLWEESIHSKDKSRDQNGFNNLLNGFLEELTKCITDIPLQSLTPHCYGNFCLICIDKCITFFLNFLKRLYNKGVVFNDTNCLEFKQINRDIESLRSYLLKILSDKKFDVFRKKAEEQLEILQSCADLLQFVMNNSFIESLNRLCNIATKEDPLRAYAIENLIRVCVGLRGHRPPEDSLEKGVDKRRGSYFGFASSSNDEDQYKLCSDEMLEIELRRNSLIQWVDANLNEIHKIIPGTSSHTGEWITIPPECRVFDRIPSQYSIRAHLVQTAFPIEFRDELSPVEQQAHESKPFTNIFAVKAAADVKLQKRELKTLTELSLKVKYQSMLVLSDLQINDIFQLHMLRSPLTYVKISYGQFFMDTVAKSGFDPDWTLDLVDKPIEFPVSTFNNASDSYLEIFIYCKNFISKDSLLGSVKIPISPHNIRKLTESKHDISLCTDSKGVSSAILKAKAEGRTLPSLRISIDSKQLNSEG